MIIQLFPFRLLRGTVEAREGAAVKHANIQRTLAAYKVHSSAAKMGWQRRRREKTISPETVIPGDVNQTDNTGGQNDDGEK